MDIFTLNDSFEPVSLVDPFISAIWTERYTKSGDVELLVPATNTNAQTLVEGSFLGCADSKEVMLIESALIENNTLKLTGRTLDVILEERIFRNSDHNSDDYNIFTFNTHTAGRTMQDVVDACAIHPFSDNGIDSDRQVITGLVLGTYDDSGAVIVYRADRDTGYNHLTTLAEMYQIGFSLYLDSINLDTHVFVLKFKTYKGLDRTSDQSVNAVVKFSPSNDSLVGLNKLHSISGYKTIVYAFAPDLPDGGAVAPGVAYVTGGDTAIDFDRREMQILVSEATYETFGSEATIIDYLTQKAKDALANNNYTKVIDGEIVPQSQYTFGVDYQLGDIIELDDDEGNSQKARIVEYIRAQDEQGERSYPTVSVIE